MIPDATEQMVQAITQKMRETYVQLGKSIIPLLTNTSEDIKTLLELGEVYENLGCVQEAITTYEHARLLNQECLPESARMYLESHPDPQP